MSPRTIRTLPDIEPILLTSRAEPFDDPGWLLEPKFDGYRGLLYITREILRDTGLLRVDDVRLHAFAPPDGDVPFEHRTLTRVGAEEHPGAHEPGQTGRVGEPPGRSGPQDS